MKILVDINHPAHVHFFRNFINEMKSRGHKIIITASSKDIAIELLQEYQLEFIHLGSYGHSMIRKIWSIPIMAWKMTRVAIKHRPDVMVGLGSSRITHAGFLTRTKSFVFTDTEHAWEQILLYKPFATKIITPASFNKNLGKKHLTYQGFHELAYLHPNRFKANKETLKMAGLEKNVPFFILRFVSWEASHDIGNKSMDQTNQLELVTYLSQFGKVIISSESPLPKNLKPFAMAIPPTKIHDLLFFATMYIGEGGTMAIEAALLGTPSILMNPLKAGVFDELREKYGLLIQLENRQLVPGKLKELPSDASLKSRWVEKKEKLLESKVDVTDWMINFVENSNSK